MMAADAPTGAEGTVEPTVTSTSFGAVNGVGVFESTNRPEVAGAAGAEATIGALGAAAGWIAVGALGAAGATTPCGKIGTEGNTRSPEETRTAGATGAVAAKTTSGTSGAARLAGITVAT